MPLPIKRALFLSLKREAKFLIWVSWSNASLTSPGKRLSPLIIPLSCFLFIDFFKLPMEHVNNARATSCVVKAFVLATPISGPA